MASALSQEILQLISGKKRKNDSEEEDANSWNESDDDLGSLDSKESSEEDGQIDEEEAPWGSDLMGDEEDRSKLNAMEEIDRERILFQRGEERRQWLERKQLQTIARASVARSKQPSRKTLRKLLTGREEQLKALKASRAALKSNKQQSASTATIKRSSKRHHSDEGELTDNETKKTAPEWVFPSLEQINANRLTRLDVAKYAEYPGFSEVVSGSPVRVLIGNDPERNQPVYRLCLVEKLVPYVRGSYKFEEKTETGSQLVIITKNALELAHGKSVKAFRYNTLSNTAVTENEWRRWCAEMRRVEIMPPKASQLQRVYEQFQRMKERRLTNVDIENMIKAKSDHGLLVPVPLAKRRFQLEQERLEAMERKDESTLLRLNEALAELDAVNANALDAVEQVNRRNREQNRHNEAAILIAKLQQSNTSLQSETAELDPFARRKVKSTLIVQKPAKDISQVVSVVAAAVDEAKAPSKSVGNLFEAHADLDDLDDLDVPVTVTSGKW